MSAGAIGYGVASLVGSGGAVFAFRSRRVPLGLFCTAGALTAIVISVMAEAGLC